MPMSFRVCGTNKWNTYGGEDIISATGGLLTDIHSYRIDNTFVPDKYKNETGLLVTMDKTTHYISLVQACVRIASEKNTCTKP